MKHLINQTETDIWIIKVISYYRVNKNLHDYRVMESSRRVRNYDSVLLHFYRGLRFSIGERKRGYHKTDIKEW